MSFDSRLSTDAKTYLDEKRVPQLIEHLFHELAVARPNDPLTFLQGILSKSPKPRVIILGAPCSGKSTLARALADKHQVPIVNLETLLRQHPEAAQKVASASSSSARAADTLCGKLVADAATKAAKSEGGWVLDGFPRTRSEAIELQSSGVLPSLVVVLDASDESCQLREPGDVDLATLNGRRRVFSLNHQEVYQCYPIGRLRTQVDANGSFEEVLNAVEPKVNAVLA